MLIAIANIMAMVVIGLISGNKKNNRRRRQGKHIMKRLDAKELIGQKLTVRDLMFIMDDIDVYDDVCESLAIAFCNPFDDDKGHMWSEYLTQEGIEKFGEVLFYPAHIVKQIINGDEFYNFIVEIDDEDDKVWKKRLRKAKEFFESAAGYCSCEDFDKWFRM